MKLPSTKVFFTSEMGGRDLAIKLLMKYVPKSAMAMLKKYHYARLLKYFCEEQELDLKIVRHLIKAGDFVVDVGANIGVYTKFLSHWVGKFGQIYSIEPVPETFDILTANVKRLQMKNVKPINCAISESDGTVSMVIPFDDRGIENHYEARIISTSLDRLQGQLKVESISLDSLLSDVAHPVTFIKIDTEGYELHCIKGCLKTLDKWKPSLLVEISSDLDNPESEGFRLVKLLKDRGYGLWWFDGKRLHRRRMADRSVNYFFLVEEDADKLQHNGIAIS